MTQMQMLLQNSRDVQLFALEVMRECDEDFRKFSVIVVETILNSYMSAEADRACGAGYGERSEERVNSRNGYRERGLETLVGEATLEVPKLRHGSYFPEDVIDRWQRVDRAVAACVVEMYVNGISTRKVRNVAREMGIENMSKAEVSRICETLDEQVADLRTCDLSAQEYPYLFVDATYVPCRVDHRFVNVAVVVAVGLGMDGHKRAVGVDVVDTENKADWRRFLSDLKERGLRGVRMVVSDDHQGIVAAVAETMQGVTW
jgi:transposase-like protein